MIYNHNTIVSKKIIAEKIEAGSDVPGNLILNVHANQKEHKALGLLIWHSRMTQSRTFWGAPYATLSTK